MEQDLLRDKLTVLVCSCDAYEDLWLPFFTLLDRYWPQIPCRIVLNTETKSYAGAPLSGRVEPLHPERKDASYGQRMRECLSHIDTPYTLLLLDDFFFRKPADTQRLTELVRWMERQQEIACVNFDCNVPHTDEAGAVKGFLRMPQCAMYKLNMQAGVWRTDRLLHYWQDGDDPWRWELFVNYLTFDGKDAFYAAAQGTDAPVDYGYDPDGMGVFRGKWVVEDVKPLFEANGIEMDFSRRGAYVPAGGRQMMPVNAKTVRYMLCRIGWRYTVGLLAFTVGKKLKKKLHVPLHYEYYPEKLESRRKRSAS